jgi:murein DD-endopeptidase MepM/ murein hydrolase activator NlpD
MRVSRIAIALPALLLGACYRSVPAPVEPPPRSSVTETESRHFTENPLMIPVEGVTARDLRDSFNAPRGGGRTHGAIDIPAPRGTPVVAAVDGQVFRLRQNGNGGITAYLVDASRRYVYYYAHLSHYSDDITEGLIVKQGYVIGYVGTSGNAPPDSPHLHFQVMRLAPDQRAWWNGTAIDVRPFMTRTGKALK